MLFYCSVTQLCPTLCNPMDCSMPGLSIPYQLPKFAHFHVHCIGDVIRPSHPLTPSSPFALNLSQHQGLYQWVSCSHQMTKIQTEEPGGLQFMGSQRVGHDQAWARACVCACARMCAYILFQIFFPYRLLQNAVYSSLCCTVGPCYLSILYSSVYVYVNRSEFFCFWIYETFSFHNLENTFGSSS